MRHQGWRLNARTAMLLGGLAVCGITGIVATGQERSVPTLPASSPHVVVNEAAVEAPPISPLKSPGPMSLEECIALGFQHQPALDAANASLAAAQTGKRALDRMIIPRLFRPDLSIRREQACLGVNIAAAGLTQVEWETRYSITRNFFTVQYIRSQDVVVSETLENLEKARKRAKQIFDAGGVDSKITKIDLEFLDIQIAQIKGKKSQINNGMLKALAALREAMGLGHDYPLEIAAVDLPAAVHPVVVQQKKIVEFKDDKGKITKKEFVEKIEYRRALDLNKEELIQSAIANRGEMVQASTASRISDLEVQAQYRVFGWQAMTFAAGADIHAKPIPQGIFNNEYRPGAIGPEMPVFLVGRKADRAQRAADLGQRANAVVEKTTNLVSLDVEAQYLKWQEAAEEVQDLKSIEKLARDLPVRVQQLNPNEFTSQAIIQANVTAIMVRTNLNDAMHMHALALAGLERATAGAFRVCPIPAETIAMPKKN
jgi:outer membrane protein TolC